MPRFFSAPRGLMAASAYPVPQPARKAGIRQTAMRQRLNGQAPFNVSFFGLNWRKLAGVPAAKPQRKGRETRARLKAAKGGALT